MLKCPLVVVMDTDEQTNTTPDSLRLNELDRLSYLKCYPITVVNVRVSGKLITRSPLPKHLL